MTAAPKRGAGAVARVRVASSREEAGAEMNDPNGAEHPSPAGDGHQAPAPASNLPGILYRCRGDQERSAEFVSDGVHRVTGFNPADFTSGRVSWLDLIHRDDQGWAREALDRGAREGRPYQLEYRIGHQDGSVRWVWDQGQGILGEDGALIAVQGFVSEITERRLNDEALTQATQRLEAHINNSPLAVIELDAELRIRRWSDGAQRLFGWSAEEVLGRTVYQLRWVHEEDRGLVREVMADMLSGRRPRSQMTNRNYRKDGSVADCEWYSSAIYDAQGRLTSILSRVLDISERKAADEGLRRSQAQLKSFIRHAPISIAMFDRDMRYLATSGRWLVEHGRGHADLVGLSHYQVHPDLPPEWRLAHQQALAGATVKNDEDLWVQADGSRMWLRWVVQPWLDENAIIGGVIISFEDITKYKASEDALRHQVDLNRYYLDTVQTLIVALDGEGRITRINRKGCEILGYCEDELVGKDWFETCLPQPEGGEQIHPLFRRIMAGEQGAAEYYENPIRCRDGRLRLIAWHNAALTDEAGRVTGILSSGEDITERRLAEDLLRESERRLAGIVGSAMDAIISVDQEQRVCLFNPAAEQMFGMTAAEVYGRPLAHLMPERARVEHARHIRDFAAAGPTALRMGALGSLRGLRASGEEFPAEASISQIEVGGEKIFTVFLRDITQRVSADTALRESRDRLKLALRAARAGHWDWDLATGRAACAAECYALWGVEQGRERLDEWMEVVHPEDLEGVRRRWSEAGAGGQDLNLEFRVNHPDLGTRWLMVLGRTIRDDAGLPVRISGLSMDITERKLAEEALLEADRRKDEFLATLAHELRNPLAPIRSAVEILKLKDAPDPTARAARDMIERQLQHLVRLVDDLMDRNRITRGRLQLRKEPVELSAVLGQAIESARHNPLCVEHQLSWELPNQPIYVEADPLRLEQVFVNLLDNACKYTDKGGSIRLSAARDGADVVVRVIDTGIGIRPEHLPRLFKMFVQVGSESERSRGGLGIGLSLARGLVEMHGGRIEVRSEGPGKGTELSVRLPILTTEPEAPPAPPRAWDEQGGAAVHRILVVDDNPDVVEALAMFLRVTGYEVETAGDGLEALQAAERFAPDLVLLDIGMPKLDGYSACRSMRQQPWGKDLVIVAMTGWGQDDDRRKSREAGFDGHLVKPVDPSALQRLLADPRAPQS